MNTVTLRHGASRSLTRQFGPHVTVRDVLSMPDVRAGLQLPENVTAVCNGRTLSHNDRFDDGDVIDFEKQAAAKA